MPTRKWHATWTIIADSYLRHTPGDGGKCPTCHVADCPYARRATSYLRLVGVDLKALNRRARLTRRAARTTEAMPTDENTT